MSLTPGTRLGVYDITAQIGEGGMGHVYRATDTRLKRQVALKVLPDSFANDPDRLARFQREAQVLASLNHPNIAHIHGLEDSGGVRALVMELVEGEDLAERLTRGPIPIDEALVLAKQIAEALEAAHEQGIIHRDLKPANIKARADGTVKVLDFGLAKAMDPHPSSSPAAALANSPTITSPAAMTAAGIILGTAAYMSPEQARGKVVDKRTDLWAFGCVLYEMLTGLRPFGGDDVTHTIAAVVRADPDWSRLPADTPAAIRRLLRRCLEKERGRRLADAADARLELDEALHPTAGDASADPVGQPASRAARTGWQRALPWVSTGVLAAVLALAIVLWAPWRVVPPPRVTRTTVVTPDSAALSVAGLGSDLALSPDGANVVFVSNGGTQLFIRALDTLDPVRIVSGRLLGDPFVSPDSQWVGFSSDNKSLMKVRITGGPSITLATVDGTLRGATWAPDNTIIFATGNPATGLQRVSADGRGTVEVLTEPDHTHDEGDHVWPEMLPGGGAVLFTITSRTGGLDKAQIAVRDLRTGTHKILLRGGSHARYVASGHLVYVAAGTLRAIPFDLNRLETHGTAVPVVPRLVTTNTGTAECAVATDGTLVYMDTPGLLAANARTLVWVDRNGKEQPIAAPPRAYQHPRLSRDGKRLALWISDQEDDIWIWGMGQTPLTRLTVDPGMDRFPVWTRDGQRIVFTSNRDGALNLWVQAADGSGEAERLTTSNNSQFPTGTTPDGHVVFFEAASATGMMLQVALDGTHRVTPLLPTRLDGIGGVVSPDGRWLAYESNRSGSFEVYVQPFPNGGSHVQVSTAGGTRPLWAADGKELFYVRTDSNAELSLWRVPVQASGATWNADAPMKLFSGQYFSAGTSGRTYDVSPDGQRFLMIKTPGTDGGLAPSALIVVQHWDEELKRLVPTK